MTQKKIFTPLYTDFYELTMAQGYFLDGKWSERACFDYFFRKMPFEGGYVVFAGLQDLLEAIEELAIDEEELAYLKQLGFKDSFLEYLKNFTFKGTIHAPEEGEIIFSNEPVLRIEGNILEAQILETLTLNVLNFQSLIATKASRMRHAAGDRTIIDFGLRRAQGTGAIMASRAAIIGGADSTSNVYSAKKYGLATAGTMAHSWIESFDDELDAFKTFVQIYPDNSTLLVDTYDTLKSGLPNAIATGKEMEARGQRLNGIRLDSGDLSYLSKQSRQMLDEAGLKYVKIIVSNQLDEYLIKSLLSQGAPIDGFGVGTNLVVGRDDAALDGVYKLTMFKNKPRLKISENLEKVILPGIKKVYRYYDDDGNFDHDGVLLSDQASTSQLYFQNQPFASEVKKIRSEELLTPAFKDGKKLRGHKTAYEIRRFSDERKKLLPEEYMRFENPHIYKVAISKELYELRLQLVSSHKRKLEKERLNAT